MGWVEITHPFHPLRGQKFPVLKTRRVGVLDTLVLRGSNLGTFAVPKEWTELIEPVESPVHPANLSILDFQSLLRLQALIENLCRPGQKEIDND